MSSKRAQIGKFLTGFVSFLLIVLFIGIFIALSSGLAKMRSKDSGELSNIHFSNSKNLLLEEIDIDLEGAREKMLVADALIYNYLGKGRNVAPDLQQFFKRKAEGDKSCIIFFAHEGGSSSKKEGTYFEGYYKYRAGDQVQSFENIAQKGDILISDSAQESAKAYGYYNNRGFLHKVDVDFMQNGKKRSISIESYLGPCPEGDKNA